MGIEEETGKRGKKKDDAGPKKKEVFTTEEHLEHIMGVHVQEYYDLIKKEPTRKVISKAPVLVLQNTVKTRKNGKKVANGGKWLRLKKISREARAERVAKKMQSMFAGDDE